jgi:transcriptional regulator with XRE-family HTH domain
MAFSENLRVARKVKGLSQEQLAELLGVSRQAVSKWEMDDGYPETEKLIQIAEVIGVSLDYLLLDRQANNDKVSATQSNCVPAADKKITIRSYDGSKLSAYDDFTIVPAGYSGRNRPKCLLGGSRQGESGWNNGLTILGWYKTTEDAQKELDEINQAIQKEETFYQLKYFANVVGYLNPKIVDNTGTV